jgi:endonuclease/exonuclease/phosphatase family metal-dependent hydrolase
MLPKALSRSILGGLLALCASTNPASAGEGLRVATYNVLALNVGSQAFTDLVGIVQRMDADVLMIQEVGDVNGPTQSQAQAQADVNQLANLTGYPFRAVSQVSGTLSGGLRVAILSKFQIATIISHDAVSLSGSGAANDIGRDILEVRLNVPDVGMPVGCFTVHFKAQSGDVNQFRRAVETQRLIQAIGRYCQQNPGGLVFVGGDLNEQVGGYTPKSFSLAQYNAWKSDGSLPPSFSIGPDIAFPLLYDPFARLQSTLGCVRSLAFAAATAEDSTTNAATFSSGSRLDYLFTEQFMGGRVLGFGDEVYRSTLDDGLDAAPAGQYLRKFGAGPLASGASASASDHFPVYADYLVESSNGGRLGFNTPGQFAIAPRAGYRGTAAAGSTNFAFALYGARANTSALLFVGALQFPPLDLGLLLPGLFPTGAFANVPITGQLGTLPTNPKGEAQLNVPLINPALAGAPPIYSQWIVLDPNATFGIASTSDAYFVQL